VVRFGPPPGVFSFSAYGRVALVDVRSCLSELEAESWCVGLGVGASFLMVSWGRWACGLGVGGGCVVLVSAFDALMTFGSKEGGGGFREC